MGLKVYSLLRCILIWRMRQLSFSQVQRKMMMLMIMIRNIVEYCARKRIRKLCSEIFGGEIPPKYAVKQDNVNGDGDSNELLL